MNTSFITCPVCGARIALPDYWTGTITCARCLNPIEPPMTRELPEEPQPVIPIGDESFSDLRRNIILAVCLIAGIICGGWLLAVGGAGWHDMGAVVVITATLVLAWLVMWIGHKPRAQSDLITEQFSGPHLIDESASSTVLDYESQRRRTQKVTPHVPKPVRETIAIAKFILGILAGFVGEYIAGMWDQGAIVVILVLCPGFVCLFARGWRAFGVGLILSLPLSIMIFFCLCYFYPVKL